MVERKKQKPNISLIILTFNEEKHIARCLENVKKITEKIYVIDSFSTDKTLEIANNYGAICIQHKWENYQARQFNWALENLPEKPEWVLRLDADEYLTNELIEEIAARLPLLSPEVNGVILKRRFYFLNKWVKHGGYYPTQILRLWKYGTGKYEDKLMDEHVKLEIGKSIIFENDFVDHNLGNLSLWIEKHNNYATREAIEFLINKHNLKQIDSIANLWGNKTERKRWLKEKFYFKLPLFVRPFIYYLYRYFIQLGFLDGKEGFIYHFLQAFWYRFLVDAKIYQIEKVASSENKTVNKVIKEQYGFEI